MEEIKKICYLCTKEKCLSEFPKDKHNKDGHTYDCRVCRRQKEKLWRAENKDVVKEINFRSKDKRKEYYDSEIGINSSRKAHLKRKFNITLEEYNKISEEQGHVCQICKKPETCIRNKFLCVDHNHTTGKIRGLLCNNCNRAIGLFAENTEFLKNAINYLNNFKNK